MEEWTTMPGYDGRYEVSTEGRVRSNSSGRLRLLKPNTSRRYAAVTLYKRGTGKQKWSVHRLVYTAFNGPIQKGKCVRHLNDIRSDNRLVNLATGTNADNGRDKIINKVMPSGEHHYHSLLTDGMVIEMRNLFRAGMSSIKIGEKFGIEPSAARSAIRGRSWAHVPNPVTEKLPGPNRKISDALAKKMKEMINNGMTLKQVADKYNVSKTTVFRRTNAI